MQLTINSFRQLFADISLTFSKIPDCCQIPRHFQILQTSGQPVISSIFYLQLYITVFQSPITEMVKPICTSEHTIVFSSSRPIRSDELLSWWSIRPSSFHTNCFFSHCCRPILDPLILPSGHIASTQIVLITINKWPVDQLRCTRMYHRKCIDDT